ncbi:MAG TPA: ABC transporter permease [Dehalococcoidales bacterium]|nr:ABC transporter permease [Dehalococcoidales bacterium]
MISYFVRRLFQSVIVLLIVTIIVFTAMRLLPGDPIRMLITASNTESFSEEQIAEVRREYGLGRPMVVQYFDWVSHLLQGDMGKSILYKSPVTEEIVRRIPITFHLGILAFIIGLIVGIPLGVISAVRRGTWLDTLVTMSANLGITVPTFWLGILMIYLFSLVLGWLPVQGYTSPFTDFWLNTRQLLMPVFCLSVFPIASTARQTRSSMLEVMRQDYIRTAWSKGLTEQGVIISHALKNGLIPIVTLAGLGVPMIVGGAVLIETVFNIPGMGRLAVTSVLNQDYPYVQGIILIISGVVLFINFAVEVTYGWLDPRIRYN